MIWIINFLIYAPPVLVAITLHEAAHGYAALQKGDDTALRAKRLSINPFRHVDPLGTIVLPALLLIARSPFIFGFAKPVPVNFHNLRHPKRDMVYVALAGPMANIFLAFLSALLLHVVPLVPSDLGNFLREMLIFSLHINVLLAIFNMIPIPPLDGGRVAVGLLPNFLARPLAGLERYSFLILLSVLVIIPLMLNKIGIQFSVFNLILKKLCLWVVNFIAIITGLA